MVKVDKEIPWCTVILVATTVLCHTLVLQGNLSTSSAMSTMGTSTAGWSRVGLGLARSLRGELDVLMTNVTIMLTDAINQSVQVQEYIDIVVSMVGNVTDQAGDKAKKEAATALLQISQSPNGSVSDTMETALNLGKTITNGVNGVIGNLITMLSDKLSEFLEAIKPALIKCGAWLLKFGDKIQQVLESFSVTLDKVQKIFDQAMSGSTGAPEKKVVDQMIYDTFSIFDVSKTGFVTLQDLQDIGEMFSIESLGGTKAKDMLEKYDSDKDKQLSKGEYTLFVEDPDIPGSMAVVLRKYAKKMSNIAGVIAQAKMRDEMSLAVVNFMQLVCSKNRTKMSWVAQMLTNGTLPVEFTAAILTNLAIEKDNPDLLTKDDIGDLVISEMLSIDFNGTMRAYDRMMNISWWTEEGFDPLDFAIMTQRVTDWITNSTVIKKMMGDDGLKVKKGTPDKIILSQTEVFQHFSSSAFALGKYHLDNHCRERQEKQLKKKNDLFRTESQQFMLQHLLGGVMASEGKGGGSAAEMAVKGGQPCKPVTLEFAKWLAWNCTDQVEVFIKLAFDYSSESTSALDSFATNIQALVKKIQSFLAMMEKYATPAGIDKLTKQIMDFTGKAADDIAKLVNTKLSGIINTSMGLLNQTLGSGLDGASKALSDMISGAIVGPLGGAIQGPLSKMIGDAVDNPDAGDALGAMLGEQLTKKLANLTSEVISSKMQTVLKNLVDQALDMANDAVDKITDKFGNDTKKTALLQEHAMVNGQHLLSSAAVAQLHADIQLQKTMSGTWDTIVTVLQTLQNFLPQSTKILKFARKEVSEAAKGMDSVFKTFEVKGPQIFDMVAGLWATIWVLYFFFVCPIALGLLFYGFWASGYCGGPTAIESEPEDVPGPKTFMERCSACCNACSMCLKGYHDTALCFWSFIIFAQVVCLLLFIISLVICILAGVNAFVVAGCSQIYMLADVKVCGQTLGFLQAFLDTFHVNLPDELLTSVCDDNQLLTCQLIEAKMKKAMIFTTVFSFLAAILSFQMLIESALLHERARWRRILDAIDKES